MKRLILIYILTAFSVSGQSFAPEPGAAGSNAIHADSSVFVDWATNVTISRGYIDLAVPGLGFATYGSAQDAIGMPDGLSVVSLGDGGVAMIQLASPIYNGPGPDFAVFENGFIDHYMEFAFVEVSTNGVDFIRFENTSEIPTSQQIDNFTTSDCRMVNNLAGKYRQMYGTPFDLDELSGESTIDVNEINFIRLIDVVGSIDPTYGSYDSFGHLINDPYPTPFESGGFDLDAVGLIHQQEASLNMQQISASIYPNPFNDVVNVKMNGTHHLKLISVTGNLLSDQEFEHELMISTTDLPSGVYFCVIDGENTMKLIK